MPKYKQPEINMCCQTTCNSTLAKSEVELLTVCLVSEKAFFYGFESAEFKQWLVSYKIELAAKVARLKNGKN